MILRDLLENKWICLTLFIVTLFVYYLTLCPTVYVGDGGELITAAATLSLAHPPGYPLYIILGKVFCSLLFFIKPALALNLFSALFASISSLLFFIWVNLILKGKTPFHKTLAFSAGFIFAFSFSIWSQATVARVYTLNAFFLLLTLIYFYHWFFLNNEKALLCFFLACGFGLANHTAMLTPLIACFILTVAVVLMTYFQTKDRKDWLKKIPQRDLQLLFSTLKQLFAKKIDLATAFKNIYRIVLSVFLLIPGLLVYLYIPLSSSGKPFQNWGDPSNVERFMAYITRKSYWQKAYVENVEDIIRVLIHYIKQVPSEFTLLGVVFILAGLYALYVKKSWDILLLGLLLFFVNIFFMMLHGSRSDITYWSRYLIPGFVGLMIFIPFGINYAAENLLGYQKPLANPAPEAAEDKAKAAEVPPLTEQKPGLGIVGLVLAFALPLVLLFYFYHRMDKSQNYFAEDYNLNLLKTVPKGATLIAQGDNVLFPLIYYQQVEGIRRDVDLVLQGINILKDRTINPEKEDIYWTHFNNLGQNQLLLKPEGLAYHLITTDMEWEWEPVLPWGEHHIRDFLDKRVYKSYLARNLIGDYYIQKGLNFEILNPRIAFESLLTAVEIDYNNANAHYNVGLAMKRLGFLYQDPTFFQLSLKHFTKVTEIDKKNKLAKDHIKVLTNLLKSLAPGGTQSMQVNVSPSQEDQIVREKYIAKSLALFKNEEIEEGVKVLKEAVDKYPNSFDAKYSLAAIYIHLKEFKKAEIALDNCLKLQPDNQKVQLDLKMVRKCISSKGKDCPAIVRGYGSAGRQ